MMNFASARRPPEARSPPLPATNDLARQMFGLSDASQTTFHGLTNYSMPTVNKMSDSRTTELHDDSLEKPGEICGPRTGRPMSQEIPSTTDLTTIENLPVLDTQGNSHTFRSIVHVEGVERHLVIFVRHFFCGNCLEYLQSLCAEVKPKSLPEGTAITIIGCGAADLLQQYVNRARCQYPAFTDPSQKLYQALGLGRTFELGTKPDYIQSNLLTSMFRDAATIIRTGPKAITGGDWKQIGGEFLFELDGHGEEDDASEVKESNGETAVKTRPWKVLKAHRMKTTRDHAEIRTLKDWLEI